MTVKVNRAATKSHWSPLSLSWAAVGQKSLIRGSEGSDGEVQRGVICMEVRRDAEFSKKTAEIWGVAMFSCSSSSEFLWSFSFTEYKK